MSIEVMTWVWRNGPKDPTARLVLLAIADHADDAGNCYPSMAGIAEKACVTERGARGIVRRLEGDGWLETKVGGGRGGKSQYRVVMGRKAEATSENTIPGNKNPETETRKLATQNPERDDTKPGTSVPPNRHRTIKEPKTPLTPRGGDDSVRSILTQVMSEEAADDFIAHRRAKRSKLTERAASLIADELHDHPNPDACVRMSIKNGWTGVFPDRCRDAPQPSRGQPQTERDRKMAFYQSVSRKYQ